MMGILLSEYGMKRIVIFTILFLLYEICIYLLKKVEKRDIAYITICFIVGIVFYVRFNFIRLEEVSKYNETICEVIGTICSDGEDKDSYWQYYLKSNYINGEKIRSRILLKSKEKMEYGSKIQINAKMEVPKGPRNSGLFDYRKYLMEKNVYIIADSENIVYLQKESIFIIERLSHFIRDKVREFTELTLKPKEAGILNALIIGDKSGIDEDLQECYKKAGMVHILVVSGGHVGFIIILLSFVLSLFKLNPNIFKIICIFGLIFYIFITGASVSVLRAGVGIIILLIAGLIGRQNDGITTIFLVSLIVLINNPNILFSISFLLSFGGALGIMICYPRIEKWLIKLPLKLREPLSLTICAQLFVTPIILYNFNVLYLGGFISNIFVLSLAGIIMMGGIVLFIVYLFIPLITFLPMKILSLIVMTMNKIAEFFGNIDFFVHYEVTPTLISIVLYYLLLLYVFIGFSIENNISESYYITKYNPIMAFLRKNFKLIVSIFTMIIIIGFNTNFIDFDKSLKISVIDVGHGDSILITTPNNKNILIDTGDKYYKKDKLTDYGEQVIVPYLLKNRIKKIDLLILTHMDSDHIGGYESILKAVKINNIGISVNSGRKQEYKRIREKFQNIKSLKAGDKFSFDGINFKILAPQKAEQIVSENNDSIVLLMKYQGVKSLFMGDLEKEGEEELIKKYKDLDIDILKIGHHGSKTSSTEEFIQATTPQIALISVGNRFKSVPGQEVLERLNEVGASIYRTDQNGEINVIIDKRAIKVNTIY
jgi:competence protein ComEC